MVMTPSSRRTTRRSPGNTKQHHFHLPAPMWWLIALLLLAALVTKLPFIEQDEAGQIKLAEWRILKLNKELDDLNSAEQYALLAKRTGYFPCFSCPDAERIRLQRGQVWKYGATTKGEWGRYSKTLQSKNLLYVIQFTGTLEQCLMEEKRKIYNYALLPENLQRPLPLMRPPGNKRDS